MQTQPKESKLVGARRVECPVCHKWIFSAGPDTSGKVEILCPRCKKKSIVSIDSSSAA